MLIDITQIKNITQDICSSYGQNPKSTFLRDNSEDIKSSADSIPNSFPKSNSQLSLKTGDLISKDYKAPGRETVPQMQRQTAQEPTAKALERKAQKTDAKSGIEKEKSYPEETRI